MTNINLRNVLPVKRPAAAAAVRNEYSFWNLIIVSTNVLCECETFDTEINFEKSFIISSLHPPPSTPQWNVFYSFFFTCHVKLVV